LQIDQGASGSFGDRFGSAPDREFAIDPGGVGLDRADADAEAAGGALLGIPVASIWGTGPGH
jgi:hypothetical protein